MKYHRAPINILNLVRTPTTGTLNHLSFSTTAVEAKMVSYRKGFKITWPDDHVSFRGKSFELGKTLKKVTIQAHENELVLQDLYITSHHIDTDFGVAISGICGHLHTKGFIETKAYYFQLVVPLQKYLSVRHAVKFSTFKSDLVESSSESTTAKFADDELQICFVKNEDEHYMFIDSSCKQSYKLFSEKVHAIKNAIGYLTGHLAADAGCFFAYSEKVKKSPIHFYYTEWRDSIVSSYVPVYDNPYGFIRERKKADKLYKANALRPLNFDEFGCLCEKIYSSEIFTGLIILILEASIASLLFMPGGFAIAMETLAELIVGPEKGKLAPIKKPALSKKIRKLCIEIINNECIGMPEEDIKVLVGRIEQINQVTNKSRLRQPFERLGITLSQSDLKILNTRNDILHGRIADVMGIGDLRTEKRKALDLYYISMRFYTLLNRLILKWIGYENFVLNHAKIQEQVTLVKVKEAYYIKD